jgi:hypothetical protein
MNPNCLQWLAHGLANQLAQLAARGHNLQHPFPFNGCNERNVVTFIERSFTGLGYHTWREVRYQPENQECYDLLAEPQGTSPDERDAWMIEAKVLGERDDNRLTHGLFFEHNEQHEFTGAILGDFERLSQELRRAQKVVVWVFFSETSFVLRRGGTAPLWIGDTLDAVVHYFPNAVQQGRSLVNFRDHCNDIAPAVRCYPSDFAHIFCWRIYPRIGPKPQPPAKRVK